MVTTGKIFVVKESVSLADIATKLKDRREEETLEADGQTITLLTEIRDLQLAPGELQGIISQDIPFDLNHHGKVTMAVRTIESLFTFHQYEDRVFLMVLEKKNRANNFANMLSKILFITVASIVEARIQPEVLRRFHEDNFDDTKIVFFDDIDIPNVDKLSLYGSALGNTSLYQEYLSHGKIWYTVIRSKRFGYIVGITRNAVITIFTRIEKTDFLNYTTNEIFSLVSRS